ncbi:hypothetical protein ANN_14610 [Periplaneta americana]|uniref:Reverse transcriptase domain-containing protein n=1 Tax=Periplaneta americana TaxID=6978 RepID=A0ABQ8SY15_PERAM|nr:hypothetical protein ANN_14610 [Periplaneta americana]
MSVVLKGSFMKYFVLQPLPSSTSGTGIFSSPLKTRPWDNCIDVCTDGAKAMVGPVAGAVTRIKKVLKTEQVVTAYYTDATCVIKAVMVTKEGVIVGRRRIKCIRFADDRPMALLTKEEMILKNMLLDLNDSCEQYGMKINANKTKSMVIGRKIQKMKLRILNEAVEQVDSLNISSNMSRCQQVKRRIAMAKFATLESSDEVEKELDVNSVWENIRDSIKIAAEQSIGYYETKKKKPWFDEDCCMVVERRKQAKLTFLQDPVEEKRDNYFDERREASRTLRNKKRGYLKEKLNEAEYSKDGVRPDKDEDITPFCELHETLLELWDSSDASYQEAMEGISPEEEEEEKRADEFLASSDIKEVCKK